MRGFRILAFAATVGLPFLPGYADDTALDGLTWPEKKCALYQSAWDWAYDSVDKTKISDTFIGQNSRFIATGCVENIAVCPHSGAELEMANMLTVMTMSEGMASTFVPFSCRDETD